MPAPSRSRPEQESSLAERARRGVITIGALLAVLWAIQILDSLSGYPLLHLGIDPRTPSKLEDILTAPFVHVSYSHLIGNTVPFAVLGFIVTLRGLGRFAFVSLTALVVSGLGVWLIAPTGSDTVGASGVIFGYFGYLIARGAIERRPAEVAVAVLVAVVYWSILSGLLPDNSHVSWQAHLFGLAGGVLAAWLVRSHPHEGAPTTSPAGS